MYLGIHPSIIADAFLYAQAKACEVARSISQPVDLANRNALIAAAVTSLNSKVRGVLFFCTLYFFFNLLVVRADVYVSSVHVPLVLVHSVRSKPASLGRYRVPLFICARVLDSGRVFYRGQARTDRCGCRSQSDGEQECDDSMYFSLLCMRVFSKWRSLAQEGRVFFSSLFPSTVYLCLFG